MGDWGLRISQSGYDVKTAVKKNLSFISSAFNYKTKLQGTGSVTGGVGGTYETVEISHNLGYRPLHWVWVEGKASGTYPGKNEIGFMDGILASVAADTTKLYIGFGLVAEGDTIDYVYYIFVDEGI